jgi:hypothetical protein
MKILRGYKNYKRLVIKQIAKRLLFKKAEMSLRM